MITFRDYFSGKLGFRSGTYIPFNTGMAETGFKEKKKDNSGRLDMIYKEAFIWYFCLSKYNLSLLFLPESLVPSLKPLYTCLEPRTPLPLGRTNTHTPVGVQSGSV